MPVRTFIRNTVPDPTGFGSGTLHSMLSKRIEETGRSCLLIFRVAR
jgi:hypothetical protein